MTRYGYLAMHYGYPNKGKGPKPQSLQREKLLKNRVVLAATCLGQLYSSFTVLPQ